MQASGKEKLPKATDSFKPLPHIDLINFDEPQFAQCRYILTSPRSLKASAILHIEPIELLPISFEEFRTNLPRCSLEKAKKLYDASERKRNDNVRCARVERSRLVKLEEGGISATENLRALDPLITGVQGHSISKSGGAFSLDSSSLVGDSYRETFIAESTSAPSEAGESITKRHARPSKFNFSRPLTAGEFNKTRISSSAKPNTSERNIRSASLDRQIKTNETNSSKQVTPQKMKKALNYSSSALQQQNTKSPAFRIQEKLIQLDRSYSRPLHRPRSNDGTADSDSRLWTPEEWEKEIQLSNARRTHMLEQNRRELKRLEEKYQRELEEQETLILKEKELAEKEEKHRQLLEEEHMRLEAKLEEHREEVQQRRARIAENLRIQQEELERYHMDLLKNAEDGLKRAQQEKMKQELLEQERRKLENRLKAEEMWRRKLRVTSDIEQANEILKRSIDQRDQKIAENQQRLYSKKDYALRTNKNERFRKEQEIADRRELMDLEEQKYREDLKRHQENTFQKAEITVMNKQMEEQRRLQETRSVKYNARKSKYEHLLALEREWKADAENILRYKEEKAKKIQQEMQARMDESRSLAKAAEQLREEIRAAYRMDSFDKKVQQVNLINKMGLGSA